jgi:hypothetical protein
VAGALAGCASSGPPGKSGKAELTTTSDATAVQRKVDIRMQLAIGYFEQGQYRWRWMKSSWRWPPIRTTPTATACAP